MKKLVTILGLVVLAHAAHSQNPLQWQQIYGGAGVEVGYGVRSCLDQGYIVVGTTSGAGPSDGYVVRTDSLGLVMWSKFYGGVNIDIIRAVELLPDSGFIMAGYSNSGGHGGYDGWLIRTDKNGDTLWTRYVGTSDWDFFYDVECTRDGGFLCAGGTYGPGAGDEDMYLVRFNPTGDTLWTKTYGGARVDEARGVIETEDSLIAICGFTYSFADTLGDSWLLRLDIDGDTTWTHTLGDLNAEDRAYGLCYDSVFDIILYCGYSMATNLGEGYWEGVYYDDTTWFTFYGTGPQDFDEFYSIKTKAALGPFAAVGTTFSQGAGFGDMWLFSSIQAWIFTSYGTVMEDHAYDFDFTHDGGYILCGSTTGYNSFVPNMYLVKGDTNMASTTFVGVPEISSTGGSSFVAAFPVPANSSLSFTMVFDAASTSDIFIEIIDITGKVIAVVPNEEIYFPDGHHGSAATNTTSFVPGIYMYSLKNSSGTMYSDKFIISR
ncbi:MAG TPA: T9SS type A sorting domain-containing protein [Bacteroidia bacterium]|nr:T9SS type A sorting domain-containing protein [Bacteroidia bacterium]